jgi:hypothetical protein
LKKSPVIADENTKGFLEVHRTGKLGFHRLRWLAVRRLTVEMGHWTGDDIETRRAFDISFFIVNLPARHGNVGRYRQYDKK